MAKNATTRRGLLGAIAVAPALIALTSAAPGAASAAVAKIRLPASADGGLWWRTFKRMERADAVSDAYRRGFYSPTHDAFMKANGGCMFRDTPERRAASVAVGLDPIEDRYERLVNVYIALLDRLLELPAPDAKAAQWKFDYLTGANEGGDSTPSWSREYVGPILADVRRFIGGEGRND